VGGYGRGGVAVAHERGVRTFRSDQQVILQHHPVAGTVIFGGIIIPDFDQEISMKESIILEQNLPRLRLQVVEMTGHTPAFSDQVSCDLDLSYQFFDSNPLKAISDRVVPEAHSRAS